VASEHDNPRKEATAAINAVHFLIMDSSRLMVDQQAAFGIVREHGDRPRNTGQGGAAVR